MLDLEAIHDNFCSAVRLATESSSLEQTRASAFEAELHDEAAAADLNIADEVRAKASRRLEMMRSLVQRDEVNGFGRVEAHQLLHEQRLATRLQARVSELSAEKVLEFHRIRDHQHHAFREQHERQFVSDAMPNIEAKVMRAKESYQLAHAAEEAHAQLELAMMGLPLGVSLDTADGLETDLAQILAEEGQSESRQEEALAAEEESRAKAVSCVLSEQAQEIAAAEQYAAGKQDAARFDEQRIATALGKTREVAKHTSQKLSQVPFTTVGTPLATAHSTSTPAALASPLCMTPTTSGRASSPATGCNDIGETPPPLLRQNNRNR